MPNGTSGDTPTGVSKLEQSELDWLVLVVATSGPVKVW